MISIDASKCFVLSLYYQVSSLIVLSLLKSICVYILEMELLGINLSKKGLLIDGSLIYVY